MSKVLRRPMFKMGGNTDSGIMSGFERKDFKHGGTHPTPDERLQDVLSNLETDQAALFAETPQYTQPGFGTAEFLALAQLGANIAAAPNRGGGIKGFAASTAPAFGQFAQDIGALNQQKMQAKAAFDAAARDAKLQTLGTRASLEAESIMADKSKEAEIEIQKNKIFQIDRAFEFYNTALTKYNQNSQAIKELANAGLSEEEYNRQLKELQQLETIYINEMYSALSLSLPETVQLGDLTVAGINETAKNNVLSNMGLVEPPTGTDPNRAEYEKQLTAEKKRLLDQERELLAVQTGLETTPGVPEFREDNAEGGRVGFQEGGVTAPVQQGQSPKSSSILSYAELRARLPQEVSDEVVRLLASSEAALLDFAQIQTQEDIRRFNQNYKADLQLPAQTQVV
tara:strand:- start:75 stop:1268 length:1194 start_codon:yes stop_codon:yes gene_type:complete